MFWDAAKACQASLVGAKTAGGQEGGKEGEEWEEKGGGPRTSVAWPFRPSVTRARHVPDTPIYSHRHPTRRPPPPPPPAQAHDRGAHHEQQAVRCTHLVSSLILQRGTQRACTSPRQWEMHPPVMGLKSQLAVVALGQSADSWSCKSCAKQRQGLHARAVGHWHSCAGASCDASAGAHQLGGKSHQPQLPHRQAGGIQQVHKSGEL